MKKQKINKKALQYHSKKKGKIEIKSKVSLRDKKDFALAYTPGVGTICQEIVADKNALYQYTCKSNMVGVITNGTAVLGLGNIGPDAALPVMEGKALLFKSFAGLDAFPICVKSNNNEEFINVIKTITTPFAAINLEDIQAPDCFLIEDTLNNELDIPVFHDDQHGTAIVVAAGIINAARLTKKSIKNLKVVLVGVGAAGANVAKILHDLGIENINAFDQFGPINSDRKNLHDYLSNLLVTKIIKNNKNDKSFKDALVNADVFIGLSKGNILTKVDIAAMNDKPWIFALANPDPEISYSEAKKSKAYIIATGRSDYSNQINNALVFPGFFKGLIDHKIKKVLPEMKLKTAYAIAKLIKEKDLTPENIIPDVFNKKVVTAIVKTLKYFK